MSSEVSKGFGHPNIYERPISRLIIGDMDFVRHETKKAIEEFGSKEGIVGESSNSGGILKRGIYSLLEQQGKIKPEWENESSEEEKRMFRICESVEHNPAICEEAVQAIRECIKSGCLVVQPSNNERGKRDFWDKINDDTFRVVHEKMCGAK